tara:strand:- start:23848 stop:24504 length:657 start_codon:yes stop_codon:yes gene_type:complete
MGKLDKHKKTKGPWGNRIIRTTQTYGKNLDRVIDQNSLIDDIEKNYVGTDGVGLEASALAVTNVVMKKAAIPEFSNAQIKAATRAAGPAAALKLVEAVQGKTLIPIQVIFNCSNLGGSAVAESGNRFPNIGWANTATMAYAGTQGFTGKGVFNAVGQDKKIKIVMQGSAGDFVMAYANSNTDLVTSGTAISMWFNLAPNGDWKIEGGTVIYSEIDGEL